MNVFLSLLVESTESPAAVSMREIHQAVSFSGSELLKRFHEAGSDVQIALAIGAVVVATFIALLLLLVLRRAPGNADSMELLIDRLDRLEASTQSSAHPSHLSAEVKGMIGYFKQELRELRQICMAIHQQQVDSRSTQERALYASRAPVDHTENGDDRITRNSYEENASPLVPEKSVEDSEALGAKTPRARKGEIPTRLVAEARAALTPNASGRGGFFSAPRAKL